MSDSGSGVWNLGLLKLWIFFHCSRMKKNRHFRKWDPFLEHCVLLNARHGQIPEMG
jgi:hypothetical protein